jgi:hypothetical protein
MIFLLAGTANQDFHRILVENIPVAQFHSQTYVKAFGCPTHSRTLQMSGIGQDWAAAKTAKHGPLRQSPALFVATRVRDIAVVIPVASI